LFVQRQRFTAEYFLMSRFFDDCLITLVMIEKPLGFAPDEPIAVLLTPMKTKAEPNPVFADPKSQQLRARAERIAAVDEAVLIVGPTGSGKEILARLLHRRSPRQHGPFVAVNCGAIPVNLLEAYFFGQVKGAFNDATNREGYLAEANGGTLFLDEIGDLPLEHQVKLLRALEDQSYRPVGGSHDRTANVRFLTATNRDLEAMCSDGRFRQDLYARINKFVLELLPLRERLADVLALGRHYADEYRPRDQAFAEAIAAALARLNRYPVAWPNGVRCLQAFMAIANVFDVEEAVHEMERRWKIPKTLSAPQLASKVSAPPSTEDDHHALANLIQAKLRARSGKYQLAAPGAALTLARLLLEDVQVHQSRIQEALAIQDTRTINSNLEPLLEIGLLFKEGEHVALSWPPVFVRLFLQRDDELRMVQPGYVPIVQSGERLCIQVTALLPIEVRVIVASHQPDGASTHQLVNHTSIGIQQTQSISFALDDTPGLEQIIIHLSWARRGVNSVSSEVAPFLVPAPPVLNRTRLRVLKDLGPGWLHEHLVHHL
jgi:DNA-binding NtrC family response regulator